ncbi:MAG: anaerobic sulfatase maturase [Oscillospiraceae bacterium]|nr:anaerobic sulfatase maturase [Oscillospiraceae bacterium]
MPPLSMLIKPVSGHCDLRCRYCFYQEKNSGIMTTTTLETIVKKTLAFADGSCTFLFQGGEPTLAGLPFFEQLVAYQNQHNTKRVVISNAMQTNGMHIDARWASFLAEHDFLVGLSLDGPQALHDKNRDGSFHRVMQTVQLFQQARVQFNILCVVSRANAAQGKQIYRFFKENRLHHLQFIPCLDPLHARRASQPWSLTPQGYLQFMKTIFDLWAHDMHTGNAPNIRYFDNLLRMVTGHEPEACGMSGVCGCQFVTEADGSVYPCDFYVDDEWKIGNILEHDFAQMRFSPTCTRFIAQSLQRHAQCASCRWFALCRGGCKRDRDTLGKNVYCESHQAFFAHALPQLQGLSRRR